MQQPQQVSVEHFSDALGAAFNYTDMSENSKAARAAAEDYLMQLKESVDGLNLAFHIISNEDFHDLRCFWAFNAVIHHLPNIGDNMSNDQAQEIYATLFGWIHRCLCTPGLPVLPEYIINKHAQMMVAGMQEFYPDRWDQFFNDMFELIKVVDQQQDSAHVDQIVVYFLEVFECIDERVVAKNQERTKEQRQHDNYIKDLMRENVVSRLVEVWFTVLCQYRETNLEIASMCLSIVQTYIDWIDIGFMLDENWINLFYFFMTVENLRRGGCQCLLCIVGKKQLPDVKIDTLRGMGIVDSLPEITQIITGGEPTNEEEEGFMLDVVNLATCAMQKMCEAESQVPEAADMIHQIFPHVVRLFSLPHFQVKELMVPWVHAYVKSNIISEEEAQELVDIVFRESPLPESEVFDPSDDLIDQRKQMHTTIRLMYRRSNEMVLQHCYSIIKMVTEDPNQGTHEFSVESVEAAVRYLYELMEAVKMDCLRDQSHPMTQMIHGLLHSTAAQHPHSMVHFAYFQLLERVSQYFVYHKAETDTLLQHLIMEPCGITNPHPKVRSSICFLFTRFMHTLKREFAAHSETIVAALMDTVNSPDAPLTVTDKMDIFEGLGMLLSISDLNYCVAVAEDVVKQMRSFGDNPSDGGAAAAADCISCLGSLAKGIGGVEATRMPDSPPLPPRDISGGTFNQSSAQASHPGAAVFMDVTEAVFQVVDVYSSFGNVREKTINFMHQIVNVLAIDSLRFVADLVPKLLGSTNIMELPKILRLVQQFVSKTRRESTEVLGDSLFPLAVEAINNLCPPDAVQSYMGVTSEAAREQLEAMRQYIGLVHVMVHSSAGAALENDNSQGSVPSLLGHLTAALRINPDAEIGKPTVQILARLATSWLSDEPGAFEEYLFNDAIPVLLDILTGPQFDLKDAKALGIVGEFCSLLRAVIQTLGERGQYVVFGMLTANYPVGMQNNDGYQFCGQLQNEQRISMNLKNAFRGVLEDAQQRRASNSGGGRNMVMQN